MIYNDGSKHTGFWRNGLQHGRGLWIGKDESTKEGNWIKGKMEGIGKIVDKDGFIYEGNLQDGIPLGHGIKKEGKFMGSGASVYIGSWSKGLKNGYGVLDDIMTGEKYMGLWTDGIRHGRGCVVNSDGVYYEGNFYNNKLCGDGVMIFEDGARYEGEFAGAGDFNGKGTLETQGIKYVGHFQGNYNESMKFNGEILNKRRESTNCIEPDMKYTVDPNLKWKDIFNSWYQVVGEENRHVWENIAIAINKAKSFSRERGVPPQPELDYLEIIPTFGRLPPLDKKTLNEIEKYLSEATSCSLHPLSKLISQLVEAFTASYGGVRAHQVLLPHAIKELSSICLHLYKIVKTLFPVLPEVDVYNSSPSSDSENAIATPISLFHPLLLPPLHPTLFMLYTLRESKPDSIYWERILRWNKHSDEALLTFLEVDPRLIQDQGEKHNYRYRDKHFLEAINTIQQIKTMFTPKQKLEVILAMFKSITNTPIKSITWSMDTLLPVCMYVVVRARILQLGAELAMLQDLMETYLFQGEQGIMLTTLLAAYHQMMKESLFIN